MADGKVYITSHDGKLYCLDDNESSLIWDYTGSRYAYSSPVVVDGRVFVCFSFPGELVCFGSLTPPTPTLPPTPTFSPLTDDLAVADQQGFVAVAIFSLVLVVGFIVIWLLLRRKKPNV